MFVDDPQHLRLEDSTHLAGAVIGWVLVRLGWASHDGKIGKHGRVFGMLSRSIEYPGDTTIVLRVSMPGSMLWRERRLSPAHNLIEAWRVARHLRSSQPLNIWLFCGNVDFSFIEPPELQPGQVRWGPTFFGFRLREDLDIIPDAADADVLMALLTSIQASELLKNLNEGKRAAMLRVLSRAVERPDFDIWPLVPLLGRLKPEELPEALRQLLCRKLPSTTLGMAELLEKAQRTLPATSDLSPKLDAGPTDSAMVELTQNMDIVRAALKDRDGDHQPALDAMGRIPALVAKITNIKEVDLVEIVDCIDRLRDLNQTEHAAEALLCALDALPPMPDATQFKYRRRDVRHLLKVFINAGR